MQGHLRERKPGVWELIVPLGRDPLTGRRRQRSKTVRGTKRDAQRALRDLLGDVDADRLTGTAVTLSDLLDAWLDLAQRDLSPTTLVEYRRLIERRIRPGLGNVALTKVSTGQLDAFYQALTRDAGLSASSVRQVHSVIRRALRQAVKWGWLAHNVAVNASPPRVSQKEAAPPGRAELRQLIATAGDKDPHLGTLIRLAASTGMRRGELCGLRWTDIDLDRSRLRVSRAVVTVEGRNFDKDTKTRATRRITLDKATVESLAEHHRSMTQRATDCGTRLERDAYVFTNAPDGVAPLTPANVTNAFRNLPGNDGQFRFHDLRHAHATQLLANGVPVRTVAGRLGHATASTTLNIYAHVIEESDQAAADVIGDILDG